ncbi:MAG: hypothetical protein ACRDJW_05770 [Thermomicrobiales bacterium]
MASTKTVTVQRAGGTAAVEAELIEGETAEQLARLAAPQLGLSEDGLYQILLNGELVKGDLFKVVKEGDTLTLAQQTTGGRSGSAHR